MNHFLYKLIPPRPTFDRDTSESERAIMGRHIDYWQDLTDSLTRILTGFALAAVLGGAVGTAIARSPLVSDLLGPVLEVCRPIPAIALVPVAILMFPSNEQGIVFITFTAARILLAFRWNAAADRRGGYRL